MVKLFVIIFAICLTYALALPVHEIHEEAESRGDELVFKLDDAEGVDSAGLRPVRDLGGVGPDAHEGGHGGPSADWGHRGHHGHGYGGGYGYGGGNGYGGGYGYGGGNGYGRGYGYGRR